MDKHLTKQDVEILLLKCRSALARIDKIQQEIETPAFLALLKERMKAMNGE